MESENTYQFQIPKHHKSIIKVIGVGGGGSNAVSHMFGQGIKDVEFVICNTDMQALKSSHIPNKLQLGSNLTEGLGAGANPEIGKQAALESKEEIRELLHQDTKMVFITAGMGGGTGTGAAPIIAKVARELDILTVGIVTAPFQFEGAKKMKVANEGIKELKNYCDTVLVILNDKLREIYGNLSISEAFAEADNVLTTAAKGIAEIITVPGYVNVDFEDVKTVMSNAGAAVMGSAETEGEGRARRAAEQAISSPLLNNRDILGAEKILLSIVSGTGAELQMDELTEITEYIQEKAGDEAEVIFGHGIDDSMGNSISVTVIATGFESKEAGATQIQQEDDDKKVFDLESTKQINMFERKSKPEENGQDVHEQGQKEDDLPLTGRSYFFMPPDKQPNEEPEQLEDLDEDDLFFKPSKSYELENGNHISPGNFSSRDDEALKERLQRLQEQSEERRKKFYEAKGQVVTTEEIKDKLETPAYMRKKVRFSDVPHSSESNVSRYNLNDDNQILGNNKFLHDNVD